MRWLAVPFLLIAWAAWGAPADDGQTAGSRVWTLNQARSAVSVTPSDSADLTIAPTRAIYVGADGGGTTNACDIAVRFADDGTTSVTIKNMAPGTWYPFQVKRILSTGTVCTQILALY